MNRINNSKAVLVIILSLFTTLTTSAIAQNSTDKALQKLHQQQQDFVDLKFGMFIHFNIPTFMDEDWADPDASPSIFDPKKLDCNQWAIAAKSANMSYGALTTKHHSGFCIWDTKTTDYNVMNSPLKRDVVKEYSDAFRKQGLKTMLYYSILDTHHKLRPGFITQKHIAMVKQQLTELLTKYGEINALIIDGWDAPWSRISYDDIPFAEIYKHIKSIQPNCLVMDLNAAKYPAEALYYTDIKSYEQGAGQHISKETNRLPALSCLPINSSWFWKSDFPSKPVKDAAKLVNDHIIPFGKAYCNFILNVAPNRDGLLDANALAGLKEIGMMWKNDGQSNKLPDADTPIIYHNLAKFKPANASWSDDMWIMDFANDDNFKTSWVSNKSIKNPWFEVVFGEPTSFDQITLAEGKTGFSKYRLEFFSNNKWTQIYSGTSTDKIKVHSFSPGFKADKIRILIESTDSSPSIAEFGVYNTKPQMQ